MPIYAYRCAACGHTKDVLRKISDPPLAECPACGAPRFEKQVTSAGFQLKGSGWYVTDFRNPPAAPGPAKVAADTPTADTPAKPDPPGKPGNAGDSGTAASPAPAAPAPAAPAASPASSAAPGPAGDGG